MVSEENALPMPTGASVHRLQGKALKQWWQISSGKSKDAYKNNAMRSYLVFLATLPFGSALLWYIGGVDCAKTLLCAFVVWLIQFLLLCWVVRRHLCHVLEVRASEDGLELRSLLFKRKIRWMDIADFFPTGNNHSGYNEFVLDCTNGDEFYLSKELTDSSKLFDLINQKRSRPAVSYALNHQLLYGLIDSAIGAVFAVTVAIVFALIGPHITKAAQWNPCDFAIIVIFALVFVPYFCLQIIKMPELVRVGHSGLKIRTRWQSKVIPWDQVTKITKIGTWLIVQSRQGWFIMFADKNEPITEKLLEYRRTLLSLSRDS